MTKTGWVFAGVLSVLPCIAGCTSEGGMDPSIGNALSSLSNAGGGQNSNDMKALGGLAKIAAGATMSESDAKQIGEGVAVSIVNMPQYRLTADDKLNGYVTKVGLTVGAVSTRPDVQFTFGVLESNIPNAFSAPGGYVFITRGALLKMQDESELAGVLAHEIGHLCLEHGKKALQGSKMFEGVMDVGASRNADLAALRGGIDKFTKEVLSKPGSQKEEGDADQQAIAIVKRAGYDPMGLARYLNRVSEGKQSGGLNFSTHPITADRVKKIQTYAAGASGAVLKERFAASVR